MSRSNASSPRRAWSRRPDRRTRLCLEALTDRLLLSVYAVINTADSGEGSLRQAILDANAHHGRDTIIFDIPGAEAHTIQPLSPLPAVMDPVIIDGTYQPGYAGSPLIVLDGSLAGCQASGLVISGGHSTVRGLDIGNFSLDGIQLRNRGGNVVAGNYIGVDVTGTRSIGNGQSGVNVGSPENTIGGTDAGDGNLISGNTVAGVALSGVNTRGNQIQGNLIGTDILGTSALPNLDGVYLSDTSGNTIGGTGTRAGNLIAGNSRDGIAMYLSRDNLVQGNRIGTDASGTLPLGNGYVGVALTDSANNRIGGTVAGAPNTIAFNGNTGVVVDASTGNAILGNAIFGHDNGLGIYLLHGGNHYQEFPTITTAFSGGGLTTIEGTLTSRPSTTFQLEFFMDSVCNYNGYGEGEHFLASFPLTTDADGNAAFTFTLAITVDPGKFIAATATDPGNSTSGFSACAEVSGLDTFRALISSTSAIPDGSAVRRELADPRWEGAGIPYMETTSSPLNPLPAAPRSGGPFTAKSTGSSAVASPFTIGPADPFLSALGEDLDG